VTVWTIQQRDRAGLRAFVYGALVLLGVAQLAIDFPSPGPASALELSGLSCIIAGLAALVNRWLA
jgi:hypothetical protein